MAVVKNLATVMTTASITSSTTTIPVNRTNVFGASANPLANPFYATIMPADASEPANLTNSEIVLVTGISGSNLIVTRAQRSTTARAFNSGAIVSNGIYADDAVLLGEAGTAVNPSPWVDTSDIKNGAVTSDKIDYTTFDQFGTAYTGTDCTAYVASFGKVAFICGTTSAYTWSGTYAAKTFTLPAGIVPSGTVALYAKLGTFGHTVDDAQYTHDYGGFTFSSSATTIGFPLLSNQAASKSCSIAFFIPCILP